MAEVAAQKAKQQAEDTAARDALLTAKAERLAVERELKTIRSARAKRLDEKAREERDRIGVRSFPSVHVYYMLMFVFDCCRILLRRN